MWAYATDGIRSRQMPIRWPCSDHDRLRRGLGGRSRSWLLGQWAAVNHAPSADQPTPLGAVLLKDARPSQLTLNNTLLMPNRSPRPLSRPLSRLTIRSAAKAIYAIFLNRDKRSAGFRTRIAN